jgi:hypothetical protein
MMKTATPIYPNSNTPMKGSTCPRGEGSRERGNASKAAITKPTDKPIRPAPKVLVSSCPNKALRDRMGRVVKNGVSTSPKRAPTKPKITAPSSAVTVVSTSLISTPRYPPRRPKTIIPMIRKTNSRLILPLLKTKNSDHHLPVLATVIERKEEVRLPGN